MRRCPNCKEVKPREAFYKSRRQSWCKACLAIYQTEWRSKHPNYQRRWKEANPWHRTKNQEYQREYYQKNRERLLAYKKLSHDPVKAAATKLVRAAERRGQLKRPNKCQVCRIRVAIPIAHHEDYLKPLDVLWVCKSCHGRIHADKQLEQTLEKKSTNQL